MTGRGTEDGTGDEEVEAALLGSFMLIKKSWEIYDLEESVCRAISFSRSIKGQ